MSVSDYGFGGGAAARGGAAGGPVSPYEKLPDGACHAHTDPGPDQMLCSPTTGPCGLPGINTQHQLLPHSLLLT